MIGHLGNRVSALIDGQLPAAEAERLWAHVHGCATCRALVEREGWVKTQLVGLGLCHQEAAPESLRGSLSGVVGMPVYQPPPALPATVDRRRTAALAFIGAGSLGAAMVGVVAFSVPAETPGVDRRPATSLTRPSEPTSPTIPVVDSSPSRLSEPAVARNARK